MNTDIKNENTYDSVFWTAVVKMTRYLIPLVNEAFGEQYTDNATIKLKPGKQITEQTDSSLIHGETDTLAELSENGITKDYHIEVETWGDKAIAVRIAEYAAGAAYGSVSLTEHGAEMTIPYSAIIFLRAADEIPDELVIDIKYPGGTASYKTPAIKIKNYSIEDLFNKKLLLLLPFYGFIFDKKFPGMEAEGIAELKDALDDINNRLVKMYEAGEIDIFQYGHLMDWLKRVLEKLTVNYSNVTKGVEDLMGGYILYTRTDEILDEIAQGIAKGEAKGRRDTTKLMNYLWENGRSEDAKKAAVDPEYLEKLFVEYQEMFKNSSLESQENQNEHEPELQAD